MDKRRRQRISLIILVALVAIVTFMIGGVPMWQFLRVHAGTQTQTATVTGRSSPAMSSSGRGDAGTVIWFDLPNHRERSTLWTAWSPPDKGDKIEVFYDHKLHEWESPGRYGWGKAMRAGLAILAGVAIIAVLITPGRTLGWLRRGRNPNGDRFFQEGAR